MNAWKGSIDFQRESGNGKMAAGALQLEDFGRWLGLISSTTTLAERLEAKRAGAH